LDRHTLDAVEVSGSAHRDKGWKSYTTLEYPAFDLCNPPQTIPQFDVVICEQVLEHVVDPIKAVKTLFRLAMPGGTVVVSTPFLIPVHGAPGDFWRFTADGLEMLLRSAGLEIVVVGSWGNAACVRANFRRWRAYRWWQTLANDPNLPVVVWAFARRPERRDE
jgi:2-polyprenyl-3-methyl-5-hydroxy-6-metoxy-1,4-benzoquinol methylase